VLAPAALVAAALIVLLSPVLVVAAVLVDLVAGRWRTMRVVCFGIVYCLYEVAGLVALLGLWLRAGAGLRMRTPAVQDAHYRLMAWWLRGLRAMGLRLFRLRVSIEDPPTPRPGPILVFSRHAGAGNSLMLVATLLLEYGRHPRIIMLEKLQWEPLFDTLLNRIPNRFIRHDASVREAQRAAIGALASGLGEWDAFVLFPEGRDFSHQLRERAIDRLRTKGHHESAEKAEAMPNVLPPRHGGVMAAIANAPGADVCFVAHTLFEDVGSLRQLWRRIPLDAAVSARYWRIPAAEVPQEEDKLIVWLYDWWGRIDGWISYRLTSPAHAEAPAQPTES
jgi:1-acyl-sn-glycerol-3-phosphate acyltransferase